jgi:hypothetical protein
MDNVQNCDSYIILPRKGFCKTEAIKTNDILMVYVHLQLGTFYSETKLVVPAIKCLSYAPLAQ